VDKFMPLDLIGAEASTSQDFVVFYSPGDEIFHGEVVLLIIFAIIIFYFKRSK